MTAAIRASSLPGLFDCSSRFEAIQLRGLRSPASGKAVLGKAVHASTAVYDLARLRGDYNLTADEAAGAAVDAIYRPEEDVVWDDGLTPPAAEKIALGLHNLYCAEVSPAMAYMAVEVTCDGLTISDLDLTITGTVDRVYQVGDDIGIADIKTGARAVAADGTVETAGHAYQLGIYEILASQAIGRPLTAPARVIGLQAGKTAKGQRAAVGQVHGARAALVGDEDVPGVLETAAAIIKSGMFHGNPRSLMCHERYCPIFKTCKYRR